MNGDVIPMRGVLQRNPCGVERVSGMETWTKGENSGTVVRNVNTSATILRNSGVVAIVALFWVRSWVIWRLFYEQTSYYDVEFVVVLYGSERLWAIWGDVMAIVRTHWRKPRKIRRLSRFDKWNSTGIYVESDGLKEMPSLCEIPFFSVVWVEFDPVEGKRENTRYSEY
jgi:hypothetical protein